MVTVRIHQKLMAAGVHLACSGVLAAMAAVMVFHVWYPSPYGQMSGATDLFLIMVGVDIALGPLATLVVFNAEKPRTKLLIDLLVVAALQLSALGYGMWTVFVARPVHLVFEYDRMRVVHAVEIPAVFLDRVPAGIDALPIWAPTLLALRPFKSNAEQTNATLDALAGIELSIRPELWQSYDQAVPEVLKSAKPLALLTAKNPAFAAPVRQALADLRRSADDTVYLPLVSRTSFGTALLDAKTAQPLALLALDSF